MYSIVMAPHKILSNPVAEVNFSGPKLKEILAKMRDTLLAQKDPEGVGLAANQVGLDYQIFLARFDVKKSSPIYTFINPKITAHSEELQPDPKDKKAPLEGCLSIPQLYGMVKRWQWVEVSYRDENLEAKTERFEDFAAIVIQHEMDHLQGHLFIERILEQKGKAYRITGKDGKGKDIWEELTLT